MGAFPDGVGRPQVGRLLGHDNRSAPRSAARPPRRRWTHRPGSRRPRRRRRRPARSCAAAAPTRSSAASAAASPSTAASTRCCGVSASSPSPSPAAPASSSTCCSGCSCRPARPHTGRPPTEPRTAQVKAPAGPRSPVPGVTIAVLLIVVGALALITRFSGWDLGPRAFLGSRTARRRPRAGGGGLQQRPEGSRRPDRARRRPLPGPPRRLDDAVERTCAAVSATAPSGPRPLPRCSDVYRGGAGDMTVDLTRRRRRRPCTSRSPPGSSTASVT